VSIGSLFEWVNGYEATRWRRELGVGVGGTGGKSLDSHTCKHTQTILAQRSKSDARRCVTGCSNSTQRLVAC